MQSRFTFLEDTFPKLADYGAKAEEALGHDNNICLLSLGRIAETITETLCRQHNADNAHTLLELELIDEDICRKIDALTATKDDAATHDYSSEMAAERLLTTAQELCEWFISSRGQGRFSFLADLFPQADTVPPLAALADFGSEAEDNLHSNTRYCLICLGDIGEFIVDTLMNMRDMNMHDKDQLYRINLLASRKLISKSQKDMLHQLRMVRNMAVHQRYASEDDGRKLLDGALELCEWMFRQKMSDGDIVRGSICSVEDDGLTVEIGRLRGHVSREEIPVDPNTDLRECYRIGERRNFRITDSSGEELSLSILQVHNDPWNGAMLHYERYTVGQDVNAIVKRITEAFGAFVELKGGLGARIPESEYSITAKSPTPKIGQYVTARIKWLNPRQYPYMLLSIRDIEMEKGAVPRPRPSDPNPNRDRLFFDMCKDASGEEIRNALENGADVNSHNKNKMTALMVAAMYNRDPEVINALAEYKADMNSKNHNGNTALIFATMMSSPEVVRALLNNGADIEIANHERKRALHYARNNPKMKNDAELLGLLGAEEVTTIETIPPEDPQPEGGETLTPEQERESRQAHRMILQRNFLNICSSGEIEEIAQAVDAGVNLNVRNKSGATGLMFAAQHNTADVLDILVKAGAELDTQDVHGNTALIYAAAYNDDAAVDVLLEAGADAAITNNDGHSAADYAAMNYRLSDTEALRKLTDAE